MEFRFLTFSLVLPGSYIHIVLIITFSLAFRCLAFLTEVTSAGFVTVKSVLSHKFTYIEEIFKSESFLEFLVEFILGTGYAYSLPEFFAEFLNLSDTFLKSFCSTTHTDVLPHDVSEFLVDRINRLCTLDSEESVNSVLDSLLSSIELRSRSICLRLCELV